MKSSFFGRSLKALVVSLAVGLGMTACGGGTIGFMWVLGANAANGTTGQIGGFKIDDFTGNLTNIVHSPFASGGANPVHLVVKPGGRFIYVINQGSGTTAGNIALFSVGGDGVLSYQQTYFSQGSTPVWAQFDSTGGVLYVLDQVGFGGTTAGDVTAFSVSNDTGRLTLLLNPNIKDPITQQPITYFPTGPAPIMAKFVGGYLLVLNNNNTVTALQEGAAGVLLATNSTAQIIAGASKLTSINGSGGSYIYLTDSTANAILPFTLGTNGTLAALTGGTVANLFPGTQPTNTLTSNNGKFLYVLNQSSVGSTNPASSISAFTIDPSSGKLQGISDSPYPVGSGPVCMVQDPSSQYVFTSNHVDGTVTGFLINQNTGQLSGLQHGSVFPTVSSPTCLVVSGAV